MIITTTNSVEAQAITAYHGVVVGEAIMGANIVRDLFASVRDVVGGRAGAYEAKLQDAREIALAELQERARALGGNAVVGVDLDYEVVGDSMLMVSASGTAVTVGPARPAPAAPTRPAVRARTTPAPPPDALVPLPNKPLAFPDVDITVAEIDGVRVTFATDMDHDPIQRHHRRGMFYEKQELDFLRSFIEPDSVFVDIGANVGNHSLFAALFLKAKRVIPVEPNPRAFRMLELNAHLNGVADRIVLDHLGLGLGDAEKSGFGMEPRDRNLGAARMLEGQGDIEIVTGDSLLEGEAPDFIKIDVEAMEMQVLEGLRETIEHDRPKMLIEVDEENYAAFEALVDEWSYEIVDVVQRYKTNKNYIVAPRKSA